MLKTNFLLHFPVQPKQGQKRPATSPVPLTPASHHHSSTGSLSNHIAGAQQTPQPQNTSTSGRGPFASALRNLAKQADIKEDEGNSGGENVRGGGSGSNSALTASQRTSTVDGRGGEGRQNDGRQSSDDRSGSVKKRTLSPQPPEKVNGFKIEFEGEAIKRPNVFFCLLCSDGSFEWPSKYSAGTFS